jgi:HAD superfamily hydrolase (TIGR01459 family)
VTRFIDGIAEISAGYDGFILDIWGVLHDGVRPYPGVVDALEHLGKAGKSVSLLSNAPARASFIAARLSQIGIAPQLYGAIVSSGEEAWQAMHDRTDKFHAGLGRRCLVLGPAYGGVTDGLGLTLVDRPVDADFILNVGPDVADDVATSLRPLLREAVQRRLPMLCANPDLHVVVGTKLIVCAGQVAKIYESFGGTVRWHGKPFASVYSTSLDTLGIADRARVLAVGDSLRTDIAGANGAGIDSLLLAGGIHAGDFGWQPGRTLDQSRITNFIGDGPRPTYVAPRLVWR